MNLHYFADHAVYDLFQVKTCFNRRAYFSQFLIIDKQTNETSAFGYVLFNLDKGLHVHSQDIKTYKSEFNGKTIWLTGLPASGKTTIANGLGDYMLENNIPFIILSIVNFVYD